MVPLFLSIAAIFLCATAQNVSVLQQTLSAHGVAAVYPTDKDFKTVSKAFNERYTFSPIAVAFPTSVAQVSAAVAAGAAQNLEVVARSGGHSYIANGLGGRNGALVVDMSKLKAITVRPANNTAIIETGNRLGDVALALNAKGRAMPHGTCSYHLMAAAGYGGFGFTSRAWGLTLDTVKSATVVLANGTVVQTSSNANPDLFFAIRGASPSFGIVTSIEVQTFPAPPSAIVFQYTWNNLDIKTASNGIASFQTFAATNIPPEFGAELVEGRVNFGLTGAWYGDAKLLNSTLAPYLKTLPKNPSSTTITPGSYINSVAVLAAPMALNTSSAPDDPNTFYTKSLMTPSGAPMSNAAITSSSLKSIKFNDFQDWFVEVELYGGTNSAINSVPLDSAAFAKRDTLFTIQFYASSSNGDPPYPKDGFSFLDGMVASIIDNSLRIGIMAAKLYYGSHYQRLQSIKAALDPKDTFRFPVGVA
ncbi:glucooligosaccharide oxidase [Mycena olivaceomarginata]|nr:glucooligosaccharide oxidase [Mycena olivaceomarginata]